jgi:hypothetical protein
MNMNMKYFIFIVYFLGTIDGIIAMYKIDEKSL